MADSYKLCFIIAHIYFRGYESYLKYYISNINKFYPNDTLILVVDNGTKYKEDIFTDITDKNVVVIDNENEAKFEAHAAAVVLTLDAVTETAGRYARGLAAAMVAAMVSSGRTSLSGSSRSDRARSACTILRLCGPLRRSREQLRRLRRQPPKRAALRPIATPAKPLALH